MKILKHTPKRLDYKNPYMEVNYTKADFGTFSKEYFVVDLGPRAGVIASRKANILMTRQYRFLIDGMSWEIPGGRVDPGETPEQAAARECLEETGVRCRSLKPLVVYYPGLDNFNNRTTLLYSEDTEDAVPFSADEAEVTEIAWMPFGECLNMVFNGEILDALTVTGLLAYQSLIQSAHAR
jgi:8-oxo-dGTP pyrophosphatase MutT (NUDIX family)